MHQKQRQKQQQQQSSRNGAAARQQSKKDLHFLFILTFFVLCTLWHGLAWIGLACIGVVWLGLARFGLDWLGSAWCGSVRFESAWLVVCGFVCGCEMWAILRETSVSLSPLCPSVTKDCHVNVATSLYQSFPSRCLSQAVFAIFFKS